MRTGALCFVDGAPEMDSVTEEGGKVRPSLRMPGKGLPGCGADVSQAHGPGWFLRRTRLYLKPSDFIGLAQPGILREKNQLMYPRTAVWRGEEAVYITSSDGFYKLRGYSIYYERNQMMQDYMILRGDVPRAETGVDDKVIQNFKQKMDERRVEAGRHRSTVGVLSGLCSVLAVTVLAGGVAMFNNYQKMHQMESVIASVVPEGNIKDGLMAFAGKRAEQKILPERAGPLRTSLIM